MKAIVAVDENWGIGRDGALLTHLPEDMKFFRTTTKGKVVVMGRKTLQSFPEGKPLKNRTNLVLTGDRNFFVKGAVVCHAISEVGEALELFPAEEVYVIGGQSIYEQFLPYCDIAYVTYMKNGFCPDTYFPDLDRLENWSVAAVSEDKEYEGLHFEFRTYCNRDIKRFDDMELRGENQSC